MKILVLGDDPKNRRLLSFGLATENDEPVCISSSVELQRYAHLRTMDVALLDWEMRGESAKSLLGSLRRLAPCLPVVAMTTTGERGEQAAAAGASDVLLKPIEIENTRVVLQRHAGAAIGDRVQAAGDEDVVEMAARVTAAAAAPITELSAPSSRAVPSGEPALVPSRSKSVQQLAAIASRVAPTPATVLLLGENGTGKTHLAKSIHEQSQRRALPFITVNCPCLQPQLLESELFGHVRGAFTGAISDTLGKVAAAEGGTLFLDEIGELPLAVQPKLLRLLQDRCYERVGDTRSRPANIRVIAATNRDLKAEVAAGRFREDLFYRLNVISLVVPSLRQRPEDIMPSADYFLGTVGIALGRQYRGFTPMAREALQRHPWPGNLRELRNTIERASILAEGDQIDVSDLPEPIAAGAGVAPQVGDFVTVEALVDAHVQRVLERADNYGHAARVLGIDKATLYRRRKRAEARVTPFDATAGRIREAVV